MSGGEGEEQNHAHAQKQQEQLAQPDPSRVIALGPEQVAERGEWNSSAIVPVEEVEEERYANRSYSGEQQRVQEAHVVSPQPFALSEVGSQWTRERLVCVEYDVIDTVRSQALFPLR